MELIARVTSNGKASNYRSVAEIANNLASACYSYHTTETFNYYLDSHSWLAFFSFPLCMVKSVQLGHMIHIKFLTMSYFLAILASVALKITKQSFAARGISASGILNSSISFQAAFSELAPVEVHTG